MRIMSPTLFSCALALVLAGGRADAAVTIADDRYAVSVEAGEGSFTVTRVATGKTFLSAGRLSGTGGTAKSVPVEDRMLGTGTGVEITHADGNREVVALFPGLPFVTFRSTFHNGGTAPVVLNHAPTVSAAMDLGVPAAQLTTLGTGGLLAAAKNPGSYAFLSIADPRTRSGVVGGWLTHERGSGVVFSPVQGEAVRMQAQLDYGRLRIKPGADATAEMFAVGYFDDARFGLEAYADAVAKVHAVRLPPHRPGYCTWYMEKHGGACDERNLAELSAYAAKNLKPYGFDFIQIDDGWQEGLKANGPKKNFTIHSPKGPFPGGMKATADAIRQVGLTPGIWYMPFAGTWNDPFFKDHQDWFAKGPDGKPYDTAWGGTCLDLTHPGAREHVRSIADRIAHEWGYTVFKMDGFWTGSATRQIYVNDGYRDDAIGEGVLSDPDKTNIEALRDGTRLVRQAAGPQVFLLGCCVSQNMRSFGGTFGLLDAMRVGPDTGAGHIGAPHASRLWFLNGRVWWNDPDCVSVRAGTPLDQARLNATFTAIADDLFYNSDWMPDFPAERLDILRRCIPSHGLRARPVDVFESPVSRIWHLADTRGSVRRDVVALYNWDKRPASISCAAERIGLPPAKDYVGFDFWADRFIPPFNGTVAADLPPSSCRVLALRPVADHPQVVSTSRHLTQGMLEMEGEAWDGTADTLSATSRVVADDAYEIRVVLPVAASSWRASAVEVATEDAAAGVTTSFRQDGPRLRVAITSPASRTVAWKVRFAPAPIEVAVKPVANLKAQVEYHGITVTWDENGADRYRLTRSDGTTMVLSQASFADTAFPRGKAIGYRVEALGWNGDASAAASIEVMPMEELKAPPKPPRPDTYLDGAQVKVLEMGWGRLGIDRNVSGKPLRIQGAVHQKGLGMHARAVATVPIPAGAARFVAVVGIDDASLKDERASVVFEVHGDVKEMGEQPVLLGQSPTLSAKTIRAWSFDVPLNTRFRELRLVVSDAGDGNTADHADWVEAGFITTTAGK